VYVDTRPNEDAAACVQWMALRIGPEWPPCGGPPLEQTASPAVAGWVSVDDTWGCPGRYAEAGWLQFMSAWGRLQSCSPEACKRWRTRGIAA
jgi:hypothetical protein